MTGFPEFRFQGSLRPSQRAVESIAAEQLAGGKRRIHVVAPPGSGKTILGLYLWACMIKKPALVLSPNSAIQAQWASQANLFSVAGSTISQDEIVSTSADRPALLTSLTYQSITLPARADDKLDSRAIDLWLQTLLEKEQAENTTAAEIWVNDLRTHNPDYYQQRLSYYRKRIRDDDAAGGRALSMLHDRCVDTLQRLRDQSIGLLILDECHHLMGHWGRVLSEVDQYLGQPVVVGLTATPPDRDGHKPDDVKRYDTFFGDVDFEVPVPAVVKDGYLAPYQDLAYFVSPTSEELEFIASADKRFQALVEELCHGDDERESLVDWLARVLAGRLLPSGKETSWQHFLGRDPDFVASAIWFLDRRGAKLPDDVPAVPPPSIEPQERLVVLIDRFTRHALRRSPSQQDHRLAERATDRLRMLGVQITETGSRPCASPISRVLAYTRNKVRSLVPILKNEWSLLGSNTRAVVIADYEKTSAVSPEITHLLDEEAGGAIAAFRAILDDETTNRLDPILLTGSTVLVDVDLVVRFMGEAKLWFQKKQLSVTLDRQDEGLFSVITGRGSDWCPRVYVEMITELFQRGVTKCLVGTRGLLGEGWDANKINVLVDLSTVASSMTVNQLRGRSIRLDPNAPDKLANNWDVVCLAPEFTGGLDDYHRFRRKHETIFGICDDGAIEQGVGHVHASFTDMQPELIEGNVESINGDMLARASKRSDVYRMWDIGNPYSTDPIRAIEIRGTVVGGGCPPFRGCRVPWTDATLAVAIGRSILAALADIDAGRVGRKTLKDAPPLAKRRKLLEAESPLRISQRDGGYVRIFLEDRPREECERFASAMAEAIGPLDQPRYIIPRMADEVTESWAAILLPGPIRRMLETREQSQVMLHAVPSVLASKRDLVDVYQRWWNHLVSPGEAVYAKNETAQRVIDQAVTSGHLPTTIVHNKEVFL